MVEFNNRSRPKTIEGRNEKKMLLKVHEGRELILNAFRSGIFPVKEAKGKGLRYLLLKQMLQRLPIAIAQVKADNTSENLLNEIRQTMYFLYRPKEITKKVYNNTMNSIKV